MENQLEEKLQPEIEDLEDFQGPFFNKLYGDFNGDKIIPHEEVIHNPIPARTMSVSFVGDMTLEEEVAIGASIEL